MKQFINVKGSQVEVISPEINVDTVYLRDNIRRIEGEEFTGWEYNEIQFTLDEWNSSNAVKRKLSRENLRFRQDTGEPLILWEDEILTQDEASFRYSQYFARKSEKADLIQPLIIECEKYINELFGD